jgi:hypothetical protein
MAADSCEYISALRKRSRGGPLAFTVGLREHTTVSNDVIFHQYNFLNAVFIFIHQQTTFIVANYMTFVNYSLFQDKQKPQQSNVNPKACPAAPLSLLFNTGKSASIFVRKNHGTNNDVSLCLYMRLRLDTNGKCQYDNEVHRKKKQSY